jgi:hypothetical protein
LNKSLIRYGEATPSIVLTEVHKLKKDINQRTAKVVVGKNLVDFSWLKGCSDLYHISPKIEDYLIDEVPIIRLGWPNRNGDGNRNIASNRRWRRH